MKGVETMTKEEMIATYEKLSATTHYIVGYTYKHMVYMNHFSSIPADYIITDKASGDGGASIRFRVYKAQKAGLLADAVLLCREEDIIIEGYNRGEGFEKAVNAYYGKDWKKDHRKFTECGDININGIEAQVKFDKATFTNEKTLISLLR